MTFHAALARLVEEHDTTPPPYLADVALARQARRVTGAAHWRLLAGAAAVAAAVAVAAVPVITLGHTDRVSAGQPTVIGPPPEANPPRLAPAGGTPALGPAPAIPAYAVMSYRAYEPNRAPWYAWDPETHRYVALSGDLALRPSPDGAWGLLVDADHGRWAVAGWADAVHGRGLHWRPTGADDLGWAPDSDTVMLVDVHGRVTTYLAAPGGAVRDVPWPAQTDRTFRKLLGYARGTDGRLVLWSADPNGTLVQTLDRDGRQVGSTLVRAFDPFDGLLQDRETSMSVSPDGRYVVPYAGVVYDLRTGSALAFRDPTGNPEVGDGFIDGWYDAGHLLQTSMPTHTLPAALSSYDTSGSLVNSVRLTGLVAAKGTGRISPYLARVNANSAGAVTF